MTDWINITITLNVPMVTTVITSDGNPGELSRNSVFTVMLPTIPMELLMGMRDALIMLSNMSRPIMTTRYLEALKPKL